MTAEKKRFSNASMTEQQYGKPHIALIQGYWRVSPWKAATGTLYYQAHWFVNKINVDEFKGSGHE